MDKKKPVTSQDSGFDKELDEHFRLMSDPPVHLRDTIFFFSQLEHLVDDPIDFQVSGKKLDQRLVEALENVAEITGPVLAKVSRVALVSACMGIAELLTDLVSQYQKEQSKSN